MTQGIAWPAVLRSLWRFGDGTRSDAGVAPPHSGGYRGGPEATERWMRTCGTAMSGGVPHVRPQPRQTGLGDIEHGSARPDRYDAVRTGTEEGQDVRPIRPLMPVLSG